MRLRLPLLVAMRTVFSRGEGGKGRRGLRKHLRGAVAGIAASLVPIIVVLEVSSGMIQGITERYLEVGTYHLQASLGRALGAEELLSAATKVRALEGVRTAMPMAEGLAVAMAGGKRTGATVRAVPWDLMESDAGLMRYLKADKGELRLANQRSALIGEGIAERLGAKPGDYVQLLTLKRGAAGEAVPQLTPFKVAAVFSSGYQELDSLWIYVPLESGLRILSGEASRQKILVKLDDPFIGTAALDAKAREVTPLLPGGYNEVYTWYELERTHYESFEMTRELLLVIMALILVVASLSISQALVMLILERQRDIAMLKSAGMRPSEVTASFMLSGMAVSFMGVVLGLVAGLLLAVNINAVLSGAEWIISRLADATAFIADPFAAARPADFRLLDPAFYLTEIPIKIEFLELLGVVAGCFALSLLVSYIPARKAGRQKPLEVLRKH